jgi:hypothetical protein
VPRTCSCCKLWRRRFDCLWAITKTIISEWFPCIKTWYYNKTKIIFRRLYIMDSKFTKMPDSLKMPLKFQPGDKINNSYRRKLSEEIHEKSKLYSTSADPTLPERLKEFVSLVSHVANNQQPWFLFLRFSRDFTNLPLIISILVISTSAWLKFHFEWRRGFVLSWAHIKNIKLS